MNTALLTQLTNPDPIGIDLALLRTRLYRFSDDHRHYVLAESLEERFIDGHALRPTTLDYVTNCLNQIRATGKPLPFAPEVLEAEGIDLRAELRAREPFTHQSNVSPACPDQIVCILGAPRSGTSHLYNLLAYQRLFAYFTTVTCWAWPTRNISVPQRRLFEAFPEEDVLTVDNKTTRIIPELVMPYEAEDIYARSIPTYRHNHGHSYEIHSARIVNTLLLEQAINAHAQIFKRQRFLTKSPFNAFRIPQLEQLYDKTINYIHITRPREEVAKSMRRNRFSFSHQGRNLTDLDVCDFFNTAITENAPTTRTLTVTLHELKTNQKDSIGKILEWLNE